MRYFHTTEYVLKTLGNHFIDAIYSWDKRAMVHNNVSTPSEPTNNKKKQDHIFTANAIANVTENESPDQKRERSKTAFNWRKWQNKFSVKTGSGSLAKSTDDEVSKQDLEGRLLIIEELDCNKDQA